MNGSSTEIHKEHQRRPWASPEPSAVHSQAIYDRLPSIRQENASRRSRSVTDRAILTSPIASDNLLLSFAFLRRVAGPRYVERVKKTVVKERAENRTSPSLRCHHAVTSCPDRRRKISRSKGSVAAKDRADRRIQRDATCRRKLSAPLKFDRTMLKVVTHRHNRRPARWVTVGQRQRRPSAKRASGVNTDPQRHPSSGIARLGKPISAGAASASGSCAAHQTRRRHLCHRPQFQPRAGVHLVLELRRLQSDLPSPVRVPERRFTLVQFISSTQGGKNSLIWHPTLQNPLRASASIACATTARRWNYWKTCPKPPASGWAFTTINPKDAQSYFVTDRRRTSPPASTAIRQVIAALKYDWVSTRPACQVLAEGQHLKISKSTPTRRPASTITSAPRGRRSSGKWYRWANCSSRKARSQATILTASPARMVPSGIERAWAATVIASAAASSFDAEKNFAPVAFVSSARIAGLSISVQRSTTTTGKSRSTRFSQGHEIRFSPGGRFLCMMNNLRETIAAC